MLYGIELGSKLKMCPTPFRTMHSIHWHRAGIWSQREKAITATTTTNPPRENIKKEKADAQMAKHSLGAVP